MRAYVDMNTAEIKAFVENGVQKDVRLIAKSLSQLTDKLDQLLGMKEDVELLEIDVELMKRAQFARRIRKAE